ncbi:MAG: hypothetical protein N4A40_11780 [Tissierellales bacterium]|jgi:hypothetical protein|nr:hypothetical protein [Tissierellales bacterium]
MKKSRILFWIGILMILIAVVFVGYALNHPTLLVEIPVIGTIVFYRIYAIVAIGLFILARIMKSKNK